MSINVFLSLIPATIVLLMDDSLFGSLFHAIIVYLLCLITMKVYGIEIMWEPK